MTKRIVYIVLVVVILCVVYVAWTRRNVDTAMNDGNVTARDTLSGDTDKMNSGAVDLDGNTAHSSNGASGSTGSLRTILSPSAGSTGTTAPKTSPSTAIPQPLPGRTSGDSGNTAGAPASDSLSENQPDGMRFGGEGKFQWYRQGNLTWRINTQTGAACIAFATMDEWQKPLVYRHGCGNA